MKDAAEIEVEKEALEAFSWYQITIVTNAPFSVSLTKTPDPTVDATVDS